MWRHDITRIGKGNPSLIYPDIVDRNRFPILFNIATSWDKFRASYCQINDNYANSNLINNPLLKRGGIDEGRLDWNFFRQAPEIPAELLNNIKIRDLLHNNAYKSLAQINADLGLNLNLLTYIRLGTSINQFLRKLGRNRNTDGTSISMESFLGSFKKGSRKFRLTLSKIKVLKTNILNVTQHKTYSKLTVTNDWSEGELAELYKSFGLTTSKNYIREFIFKFLNNCLPINTRASHFAQNVDRSCTFCTLSLGAHTFGPAPEETFIHLFFIVLLYEIF